MQSFVIPYKSFWVYSVGVSTKTSIWDSILIVLGVRVVSTDAHFGLIQSN